MRAVRRSMAAVFSELNMGAILLGGAWAVSTGRSVFLSGVQPLLPAAAAVSRYPAPGFPRPTSRPAARFPTVSSRTLAG
ncbi:hypothetical protein GCM10018773_47340 [Streptomyces candidus]|nr:hypothetical protein GCM10018773_47340 [Streptomyces candidus]